jgi:hypothetical protein
MLLHSSPSRPLLMIRNILGMLSPRNREGELS